MDPVVSMPVIQFYTVSYMIMLEDQWILFSVKMVCSCCILLAITVICSNSVKIKNEIQCVYGRKKHNMTFNTISVHFYKHIVGQIPLYLTSVMVFFTVSRDMLSMRLSIASEYDRECS